MIPVLGCVGKIEARYYYKKRRTAELILVGRRRRRRRRSQEGTGEIEEQQEQQEAEEEEARSKNIIKLSQDISALQGKKKKKAREAAQELESVGGCSAVEDRIESH